MLEMHLNVVHEMRRNSFVPGGKRMEQIGSRVTMGDEEYSFVVLWLLLIRKGQDITAALFSVSGWERESFLGFIRQCPQHAYLSSDPLPLSHDIAQTTSDINTTYFHFSAVRTSVLTLNQF